MLVESQVVDAVAAFLSDRGFQTARRVPKTSAHGVDLIVQSRDGRRLHVEAKGQTSEQPGTNRYGLEFSPSQKLDHLGAALAQVTPGISKGEWWAIALPGDKYDRELVEARKVALARLPVLVLLVEPETRKVSIEVGAISE